jgi:hypothetical protein
VHLVGFVIRISKENLFATYQITAALFRIFLTTLVPKRQIVHVDSTMQNREIEAGTDSFLNVRECSVSLPPGHFSPEGSTPFTY